MELSTLENNIRNKLENRRINPSENAWDKLENKLDGEKKTFKKSYWWMGIAASFLAGILISWLVFSNQGPKKTNYLASVQQKKTNTEVKPSLTNKKSKSPGIKSPKAHKSDLTTQKSDLRTEKKVRKPVTRSSQVAKVKSRSKKAKSKSTKQNSEVKHKNIPEASANFKTVIAENVQTPNNDQKTYKVTDAEIDHLLHKARLKIKAESKLRSSKNTVSASVLLQEVETEKDTPLKDKIIKTIKDGLNKVGAFLASNRY